jgi:lipoate-protein ligase A
MKLLVSHSICPYFNLATEAYFLQNTEENILFIWQSESAVVSGKHQNICSEINYKFCKENSILPARRLSGGGTVFHDMGNINFTFIKNIETEMDKAVNYKQFLEPIRAALNLLGIETNYSHRDDLLLNGKKISGNAQHVFQQKKRVLHHGTLLYDSQLNNLKSALHSEGHYIDKAVKSVRSEVTNIRNDHNLGTTAEFLKKFIQVLNQTLGGTTFLTQNEADAIVSLKNEKFSQENWILGYSPKYNHQREIQLNHETYKLEMLVDKGIIAEMSILSPSGNAQYKTYTNECIGQPIGFKTLKNAFSSCQNVQESELLQFF